MKVITIVWLATYYDKNKNKLNKYNNSLLPIGISLIAAVLMFFQPDLGTTIIYGVIVFSIFVISPVKKEVKWKSIAGGVGCAICAVCILFGAGKTLLLDRQLERITEFRNPCDKLLSSGNQVCNSYIAINNGGITGAGLGNSTQKYLYLQSEKTRNMGNRIFKIAYAAFMALMVIAVIVFMILHIKAGLQSGNAKLLLAGYILIAIWGITRLITLIKDLR